jgi:hypothetical protein
MALFLDKAVVLILASGIFWGCASESVASEFHLPIGLSGAASISVNVSDSDNCKSATFKIPKEQVEKFVRVKGKTIDFLANADGKVNLEPWGKSPVPDFGMTDKTKIVHLGCDFGDERIDDAYNKKLVIRSSFFSFSSSGRLFLLLDIKENILYYKYQGN